MLIGHLFLLLMDLIHSRFLQNSRSRKKKVASELLDKINGSRPLKSERFITDGELDKIWLDDDFSNLVKTSLAPSDVRASYLKIISILAVIDWHFNDKAFDKIFVLGVAITDKRLPFDEAELQFLGKYSQRFFENQENFMTVCIEDDYRDAKLLERSRPWRLPFLGEPILVGRGGFGQVFSVEVAPRSVKHVPRDAEAYMDEKASSVQRYRFESKLTHDIFRSSW